jgi:transcription-repair coupling factor (superfamily II helicase)
MIAEAVSEFRGQKIEAPSELKLELPVDARIPIEYVDSDRLRLEVYHKLASASGATATQDQLIEIQAEIADRFGPLPTSVHNLIEVTQLRQMANRLGLLEVNLLGLMARIQPVDLTDSELVKLSHTYPTTKYLKSSHLLTMSIPKSQAEGTIRDREVIDFVRKLLEELQVIANGKARKSDSDSPST